MASSRDILRPHAVWYTLEEGGKLFSGPAPENAFSFGMEDGWWWLGSSHRLIRDESPPVFAGGKWWPESTMMTFTMSVDKDVSGKRAFRAI